MGCNRVIYPNLLQIFLNNPPNRLRRKGGFPFAEQYKAVCLYFFLKLTTVSFCKLNQFWRYDLQHTFFASFSAYQQAELVILQKEGILGQCTQFRHAKAGAKQQLQHHDIP